MFANRQMACILLLGLLAVSATATQVTPIEKVLEMMNEMVAKGTKEKEAEEVTFTKFSTWCTNQEKIKNTEITKANEKIEKLKAEILKAEADINTLTGEIQDLDTEVAQYKKDSANATEVREKERLDFQETQLDFSEAIHGLEDAIDVEKAQPQNLQQALIQVRSKIRPNSKLYAFLQEDQPDVGAMPSAEMGVAAPAAAAYESHSGGTVEVFEKLDHDFIDKKDELEKEEMKAQFASEGVIQQLTDNIEDAENTINKKSTLKAQTEQAKGQAEADLAQTTSDRDEDQKYLDSMVALCEQKTTDFENRQKLRAEELEAINKAIEIISSNAVAGSGEKHLPTLLQIGKATALAQLRSTQTISIKDRVAAFLQDRARSSGSKLLAMVAERAGADPFKKVKKMIKDLIGKLTEEATSESEHKGWCDTELTTNQQTRDARTEDVNTLNAEIEDLNAQIVALTTRISDLTVALQELDQQMASATEDRLAAKAKNEETIMEAKEAQTAVEEATAVLKDFYAKSAQATSLAQQPEVDAPETFDKPYTGMGTSGGNVVDFLEVILADFARLESDTTTQEKTEAEEYDTYMFESKKDTALKENEKKHAAQTKIDRESALQATTEELASTQEELDKAMAYYDKLKPTCVDSGISYEERVKRREEEIQSLGEALKILAGDDI